MNRILLLCVSLCSFSFSAGPGDRREIKSFPPGSDITAHSLLFTPNFFQDSALRGLRLNDANLDGQTFHLFSHGRPGELLINGKWLDTKGIASFLRNQPNATSLKGLNIYGCEFGQGKTGRAAVSYLSEALAMTVSASDDLTGKDGDWDLEVGAYVSVKGLENFSGNLQCAGTVGGTAGEDDFDGDGICNDTDIDDDNDGIPDAVESPGCFFTEAEAKVIASVTTQLNMNGGALIGASYDGNTATESSFANAQDWVNKSIFEITPTKLIAVSSISFDVGSWALSNGTGSTFKLQGWNGSDWIDLSGAMYSTGTGIADFSISNTLHTATKYAKYRITGVEGTCSYGGIKEITLSAYRYLASAYPKPTCSADIDTDSKNNHQDLDSDGDGCSDLGEAGVSPTTDMIGELASNTRLSPTGTDANDDGLNDSVDADLDGIVDYLSTYGQYALNSVIKVCADIDGDAKTELEDYDDDNDGILDVVESPDCFYTEAQAKVITSVTTELTMATGVFILAAYDGNTVTQSSFATPAQDWVNKSIFEITPTTAVAISSVKLTLGSWALSNGTGSTFKLQGWSGSLWVDLSAAMYSTGTSPTEFTISNSLHLASKYAKYRVVGVAGTSSNGGIYEITLVPYQFVQALHPKPTCAADTDLDGIFNHQDLDSDGDGCTDATEGGAGLSTSDLKESDVPKGNSGDNFNGIATFGVDDNLGKVVDSNGVPTIANGGQSLGMSQTMAGTACPEIGLPVTLISFNAQQATEGIRLTWRTADETNFDRFELEYSKAPKAGFSQIGVLKGGGATYVYTDAVIRSGPSYYRLKMIDTDGTYSYSRIVTLTRRNGLDLDRVYPNPSNVRSIFIATNAPITSYKINDATGREVTVKMSGQDGQYAFKFPANVTPGLYVITYKTDDLVISQQFALTD
jgi:hypothetical protein